MSYTTLNRFLEPKHVYAPGQASEYTAGIWWPDFGPCSYDYSEQHKMHPTNTMFKNQLAIPKERRDAAAAAAAAAAQPPVPQFRRNPHTEALYKSVTVMPYKSGTRADPKRERANYQAASVKLPPTLRKEEEAFTSHMARSLSTPALGASTLPTSLVQLRQSRALGGATGSSFRSTLGSLRSGSSRAGDADMPEWVASHHPASRPPDAAGHAGTTQHAHCRTTMETGKPHETLAGGANTLRSAAVAAKSVRMKRWEALVDSHATGR